MRKIIVVCLCFFAVAITLLLVPSLAIAQDGTQDKPVFWTSGGNWGRWLKVSNYPGIAVRTACGDDTTLNNYPVSSEDWQLQNNYRAPMVVVWRVQFFNKDHGRNEMSGWMLEHLKANEVSNGWTVTAGHCKAWNTLTVQVKCAVPDTEENAGAACFKDSQGNPIAERADQFRERPPQPSQAATTAAQPATSPVMSGYCTLVHVIGGDSVEVDHFFTGVFRTTKTPEEVGQEFEQWAKAKHPDWVWHGTPTNVNPVAEGVTVLCHCYEDPQTTQDEWTDDSSPQLRKTGTLSQIDWSPK